MVDNRDSEKISQTIELEAAHLTLLRQGVEDWNAWRRENPDVTPRLSGTDLKGADLRGFDLGGAQMPGADLTGADLQGADFRRADLSSAVFYEANLDGSDLSRADLREADLLMATASGAIFSRSVLRGARLAGAVIRDAQLSGADLRETDLREAELQRSDLRQVKFDNAILWTTNLEEADLRRATGMMFDETIIRNARFSPRSPDRWSTLRRHYTGPRYALTLLLLVAFVAPYFVKAVAWVGASRGQQIVQSAIVSAESRLSRLQDAEARSAEVASEMLASIQEQLPNPAQADWKRAEVWELLLGVDKGVWYLTGTLILILYNLLRGLLTLVVGPMRDAEERSGVVPAYHIDEESRGDKLLAWFRGGWGESYAWLWLPHRIVTLLFVAAGGSFLFHAVNWLTAPVWLPR